ncbi:MAG: DUF4907 domain-containing protein [Bacteroidetes bacterium]|nr:DUF4907 domain-containing protein [Bacteroidota bacterium]MBS1649422.1 DUF4907 domain-containing protein [Bacteroidota bacterium]
MINQLLKISVAGIAVLVLSCNQHKPEETKNNVLPADAVAKEQMDKAKKSDSIYVELKIIKTDFGYGYEIYKNHEPFIRQDYIPAIEGRKGFVSEEEAKRLGDYVVKKMTEGKMQFPSVTPAEIDSLHITH